MVFRLDFPSSAGRRAHNEASSESASTKNHLTIDLSSHDIAEGNGLTVLAPYQVIPEFGQTGEAPLENVKGGCFARNISHFMCH